MIHSTDAGSLPYPGGFDEERFLHGCELFERSQFQECLENLESVEYFEKMVSDTFIDKINSGIDVPCYPQYRDMITQFTRFYEIHEGYFASIPEDLLTDQGYNPRYTFIAEVEVLKKYSKEICERTGKERVDFKICITSPLDLSFRVPTEFLVSMAKNAIADSKYLRTRIVTLDIPSFGYLMVVDRTLESCRDFFDGVKATGKDVEAALHLHSGNHRDFLEIESLDILEIHSEILESPPILKKELESYDKFIQAGIASTSNLQELEPLGVLEGRAKRAADLFGDRVRYLSSDCALKGLPSYEMALQTLRNVSRVAQEA